jgi:hypothetical protein
MNFGVIARLWSPPGEPPIGGDEGTLLSAQVNSCMGDAWDK